MMCEDVLIFLSAYYTILELKNNIQADPRALRCP